MILLYTFVRKSLVGCKYDQRIREVAAACAVAFVYSTPPAEYRVSRSKQQTYKEQQLPNQNIESKPDVYSEILNPIHFLKPLMDFRN